MLMSTAVKYSPYSLGNRPVSATPRPSTASETIAKVCSRSTNSTKTAVNARNPGTSRRLCRMPISRPVNAARSITKLLSSADQVAQAMGMAILMSMSRRIF